MQKGIRCGLMLVLVLFTAFVGACSKPADKPPQPHAGQHTPRTDTPEENHEPDPLRIVALSPALAVILTDLGYEDAIVGRHSYDMILDPAIPVCGEQNAFDYEALLRANPTHVFTQWGTRKLPQRFFDLASAQHWIIHDFRLLSLEDIDAAATQLDSILQSHSQNATAQGTRHAPSPRIARLHELAVAAHDPDTSVQPRWTGRVLLLMGTSPIAALGPGSAHAQLLAAVGGLPAITQGSPYMPLHEEDLIRLAPDAIVLIAPAPAPAFTPSSERADAAPGAPPTHPTHPTDTRQAAHQALLAPLRTLDLPAARTGRLAVLDDPLGLLPSTALADIADELQNLLDSWARETPDASDLSSTP